MTCYARLSKRSAVWHILRCYQSGLWQTWCGRIALNESLASCPEFEGPVLTRDGLGMATYEPTAHKPLCKQCDKARGNDNN